uniref:Myb family transcription factor APL n=1 Tax=Anthurium amnicola TaxID=1678845 RepID=A0A1D1Z681_9ARAE
MYHHHPGKNGILASRTSFHQDRHLFLQGPNVTGDTGLVLSTDAKPRLKWTPELHERFIEAVNQLGGADKATPKTIMRLMGIPGLTLYHLKSHLQKYRLSKNLQAQANNGASKNVLLERPPEVGGTLSGTNPSQTNKTLQISEALQMQIEVQKRLHEQLEVQRHLQVRIEAQGKYLQSVLEKAQETLGKQNFGSAGLEAAKVQLSELVSEVSNECLSSTFPGLNEMAAFQNLPEQKNQHADCSMDSCLTSSEGIQKDQDIHNINMRLRANNDNMPFCTNLNGENRLGQIQLAWADTLKECKLFSSSVAKKQERTTSPARRNYGDLSISIRVEREKGSGDTISEVRRRERERDNFYLEQPNRQRTVFEQDREKTSSSFGHTDGIAELDLNTHDENATAPGFKEFDLNGFSWS